VVKQLVDWIGDCVAHETKQSNKRIRSRLRATYPSDARRFSNLIDTVTVESMAIYIKQVDSSSSSEVVR